MTMESVRAFARASDTQTSGRKGRKPGGSVRARDPTRQPNLARNGHGTPTSLEIPPLEQVTRFGERLTRLYGPAAALLDGGKWATVHRSGCYAYTTATNGAVPTAQVLIPSPEQVVKVASDLHEQGYPWQGEVLDWPARYTPRAAGRWIDDTPEDAPAFRHVEPATFTIGICGVWRTLVRWESRRSPTPRVWCGV